MCFELLSKINKFEIQVDTKERPYEWPTRYLELTNTHSAPPTREMVSQTI